MLHMSCCVTFSSPSLVLLIPCICIIECMSLCNVDFNHQNDEDETSKFTGKGVHVGISEECRFR